MDDHDLVVIETPDGTLQITEPKSLARYVRWIDRLPAVAITGADAADFCLRIRDGLKD